MILRLLHKLIFLEVTDEHWQTSFWAILVANVSLVLKDCLWNRQDDN